MKLSKEIEQLLKEDEIDEKAAMRLMLVTQKELLERIGAVEASATANGEYLAHYPSITWLWAHRKKGTVAVVVIVFLLLYFMLTPITISDLRHSILDGLGLPHDMGLNGS